MICTRVFCVRWKDIGTIAHNKSAITVEITSRDDTIIFHMVSVLSAILSHALHKVTKGEVKQKSLQGHSQISAEKGGNSVLFPINTTAFIQSVCDFFSVFVSEGGYGNGQIRCSPLHGQAQILQTKQDLCRVSHKPISETS